MDEEVVKNLTQATSSDGVSKGITVTPFGDVLSVSKNIQFGNIRQKSKQEDNGGIYGLQVFDAANKPVDFSLFNEIIANEDGSIILLVSSTSVAFVEIPKEFYSGGYLDTRDSNDLQPCSFRVAFNVIDEKIPHNRIAKASFHPSNKYSILILLETDIFLVYDIRTCEDKRYRLPIHNQFTSFCCGPDIDWLRFSVFLANTRGELFAICPVIPLGTMISLTVLEELWTWADNQREFWIGSDADPNDRLRSEYVHLLETYLCELFGDIENLLKSSDNKDEEFVIAGEGKVVTNNRGLCTANYNIVTQGPLLVEQGKASDKRGVQQNDHSAILDLCAPYITSNTVTSNATQVQEVAPVIAAVRNTGFVEVLLFDGEDERVGYIAPSFESLDPKEKVFSFARPKLLQADTFTAPATPAVPASTVATPANGTWRLSADPVYTHYFYLLNKSEGRAFILSSGWLKSMTEDVSEAVLTAETHVKEQESTWRGDDMFSESKQPSSTSSALRGGGKVPEISLCLPLFEPPPNTAMAGLQLQSFVVYYDAYLGHVALLLLSNGHLIAINVSVHTKLCQLHSHLQHLSHHGTEERDRGLNLLPETLRNEMKDYYIPYRTTQTLMKKIEKGLQQYPMLEVTVENEEAKRRGADPSPAEAQKLKMQCTTHIESEVIVPLKRLHENTLFYCDIIRDRVQLQRSLLDGDANSDFPGIRTLLQKMSDQQQQLQQRVDHIHAQDAELREMLQAQTDFTTNLPRPLTRAERVYHRQLKQWLDQVKAMNEQVALLKMKMDTKLYEQSLQQQQALPSSAPATASHQPTSIGRFAGSATSASGGSAVSAATNSAARGTGNTTFFKASATSFFAPNTGATQASAASVNTSLATPWTAARPTTSVITTAAKEAAAVEPGTPPPATPREGFTSPTPASASASKPASFLSPPSSAANTGLYYYHPEAVRYPPSATFASPSHGTTGGTKLPSLSTEELAIVEESLRDIEEQLKEARKVTENTWKDLKHHQRNTAPGEVKR